METFMKDDGSYQLTVSDDELCILSSSMNEALEALPDSDLSTRMGTTREEVRALIQALQELRQ